MHESILKYTKCFYNDELMKSYLMDKNNVSILGYRPWEPRTLSFGYPSLVVFFTQLLCFEPNARVLKSLLYKYIKLSLSAYSDHQTHVDASLFGGLGGLSFAVWNASQHDPLYHDVLNKIDHHVFQLLDQKINHATQTKVFKTETHDVIQGLSGLLRYFLLRRSEPRIENYIHSIIQCLTLCLYKTDHKLGWLLHKEDQMIEEDKLFFQDGCYNLGMAHGMPGVLSALSLAKLNGFTSHDLDTCICMLQDWILSWKMHDQYGCFWPGRVSLYDETSKSQTCSEHNVKRQAWCYGTPGVTRALFLAAKAFRDQGGMNSSLEDFLNMRNRPEEEWMCFDATFCHGYAGLLQIGKRFLYDTQNQDCADFCDVLERRLKQFESDLNPFLFKSKEIKHGQEKELNHIGILDGATGCVLSLLPVTEKTFWDFIFLIA